jgi:nucleotide-binding universal stress UspA family protein
MNTKPIVLATDGSPSAAEATLEAVELADAFDAPLVVISVEHPAQVVGTGYYGYGELLVEIRKAECKRVEQTLEQTCAAAAESDVVCEPVHAGNEASVADQICRLASARKARMIVIGAHGWSPVRRVLHGSVSTAVVHEAHCPVLVVPSGSDRSEHALDALDGAARTRQPA